MPLCMCRHCAACNPAISCHGPTPPSGPAVLWLLFFLAGRRSCFFAACPLLNAVCCLVWVLGFSLWQLCTALSEVAVAAAAAVLRCHICNRQSCNSGSERCPSPALAACSLHEAHLPCCRAKKAPQASAAGTPAAAAAALAAAAASAACCCALQALPTAAAGAAGSSAAARAAGTVSCCRHIQPAGATAALPPAVQLLQVLH